MDKKTRKAQVVLAAVDPDGQGHAFLLLKTNERRGGFWQNVTGKVEDAETYEEGALREAMEETGLDINSIVDIVDLKLAHDFTDQRQRKVHEKSYLIMLDKQWTVKLDPGEHDDFRWVHIEELHDKLVKYPGNFEALQEARRLIKQWGR